MGKCFQKSGVITEAALKALLNDDFLFHMAKYIRSECKGIILTMLEEYGPQ